MNDGYFPICRHKGKDDCFGHEDLDGRVCGKGYCNCLSDTDFGGKECPFYKPLDVRLSELRARERERKMQK